MIKHFLRHRSRAIAELVRDTKGAARLEFSPRLPPWSRLPTDGSVEGQLRYAATRAGRLSGASRTARVKVALLSLFWPLKATLDAAIAVIRYGTRVKAISAVGCSRQWLDAMALAHVWNYSPQTYYVYRFWDPQIRPIATAFLQVHELVVLQSLLNERVDTQTISNKATFALRCAAAGIPTPVTVAIFKKAAEEWVTERLVLPRGDLFIKRVNGMQGIGGERWVYDAVAGRWGRRNEALTGGELLDRCRSLALRHAVLLQHCLSNHPDLARFSPGPLCTFRVMTYLDEAHRPALVGITLKLARSGSDVDNLHAGGIACAVDPSSGRLGAGLGRDPADPLREEHPDTRALIKGAYLTTHRDVIQLALTAHERLDVPWSVGWDVAMTPDGPILVEGNALWGADILHGPHRAGLKPDFAKILLRKVREATGVHS